MSTRCSRRNISLRSTKIDHKQKIFQNSSNVELDKSQPPSHLTSKQSSFSTFKLSHVAVAAFVCVVVAFSQHLSPVSCKLTRKTYTVWDLTPEEFEGLLEQEKSLQKRKRSIDYFVRRRAKKTKELLPLDDGYGQQGSNNLGNTLYKCLKKLITH